eukprot:3807870-Alexandrium_andersonii.AAC.1
MENLDDLRCLQAPGRSQSASSPQGVWAVKQGKETMEATTIAVHRCMCSGQLFTLPDGDQGHEHKRHLRS